MRYDGGRNGDSAVKTVMRHQAASLGAHLYDGAGQAMYELNAPVQAIWCSLDRCDFSVVPITDHRDRVTEIRRWTGLQYHSGKARVAHELSDGLIHYSSWRIRGRVGHCTVRCYSWQRPNRAQASKPFGKIVDCHLQGTTTLADGLSFFVSGCCVVSIFRYLSVSSVTKQQS